MLSKRSVINTGIRLYNKLPSTVEQLESYRDFKQILQLFLVDHPCYSLNDFFEEDNRINN